MDAKAKAELNAIVNELNSIIGELESISRGVRRDFTGIGNDRCANCLDSAVEQYRVVKRKLENIDTTTVTEKYAQAQGGK